MRLHRGADGGSRCIRRRGEFKFYPRIAGFDPWFSYIPYVLLVALPTILEAKERRTWLR